MTDDVEINEIKIDENMHELLDVMNNLPGIYTFSSCGGHMHPSEHQLREGEFYVCFDIDQDESDMGLISLELLTAVCQEHEAIITSWFDAGLHFELHGLVDPNLIANDLQNEFNVIASQIDNMMNQIDHSKLN